MYACEQDARPLDTGSDRVGTVANDQKMRVTDAQVSDTGVYTCLAVSIVGKGSKTFNVRVFGEFVELTGDMKSQKLHVEN